MELNIHHGDVKIDLVFASLIAQSFYRLEERYGIQSASVTLRHDSAQGTRLAIIAEFLTTQGRIVVEAVDQDPKRSLMRMLFRLRRQLPKVSQQPIKVRARNRRTRRSNSRRHRIPSQIPSLLTK